MASQLRAVIYHQEARSVDDRGMCRRTPAFLPLLLPTCIELDRNFRRLPLSRTSLHSHSPKFSLLSFVSPHAADLSHRSRGLPLALAWPRIRSDRKGSPSSAPHHLAALPAQELLEPIQASHFVRFYPKHTLPLSFSLVACPASLRRGYGLACK